MRVLAEGASIREARLVVLLLHGRARTPEEMIGLARDVAVDGVRWIAPEAPGSSWYPGRFMEPFEANQPALGLALAQVDGLVREIIAAGVPAARIALCGFSQGACLAVHSLVSSPRRYAGLVVLTGGLIGPPGTPWPDVDLLREMPVLLTGSEIDDWVPPGRARETAAWLERQGAGVDMVIYEDRPHEMSADEILRTRTFLETIRPGRDRSSYWR